jgi:F0F1-type ATP synthase assembly protein I
MMNIVPWTLIVEVLLALLAGVVALITAIITVAGGLAQVWLKHYLEQRRSKSTANT